jgi:hypothetical protein
MNMLIAGDFIRQSKVLILFAFATFLGIYTFEYSLKVEHSSDLVLEGVLVKSLINEVVRMVAFIVFGALIAKKALENLVKVSFLSATWNMAKAMVSFIFMMIFMLLIVGAFTPELEPGQELKDIVITNFQYGLLFTGLALVVSAAIVSFVQHSYNAGVRKNCKQAGVSYKSFPLYKNDYLIPFKSLFMLFQQPVSVLLGVFYILLSALTVYLSRENVIFITVFINAFKMTALMLGAGVMIRILIHRAVSFKDKEAT